MISQLSVAKPISFRSGSYSSTEYGVADVAEEAISNIPAADKLYNGKHRKSFKSLAILGTGTVLGPVTGAALNYMVRPDGIIIKLAENMGNNTRGFDTWLAKLGVGEKIQKLIAPLRKNINTANFELFQEGFRSGSLKESAKAILSAEKASIADINMAKTTLATLEKINGTGILGRALGKTALFFRNNLSGLQGVCNGLFAAITVNSVIQAKKGERVSTFMEDFLGTWIGSMGGYKLFEGALKGLAKVSKSGTKEGLLPVISKYVDKIPGKQFVVPLIGAMVLSNVLQNLSHKIFGKPTKELQVLKSERDVKRMVNKNGQDY